MPHSRHRMSGTPRDRRSLRTVAALTLAVLGFSTLVAATTGIERHGLSAAAVTSPHVATALDGMRPAGLSAFPRDAWVAVSVASLWDTPSAVRKIDAPALAWRVDVSGWIRRETVPQRLGLVTRLLTQALLGERVSVLDQDGAWSLVRVPLQRGSGFPRGIVGWVPTRQLDFHPPASGGTTATVVVRSLTLAPGLKVGYGTELPVLRRTGPWVTVDVPRRGGVRVPRAVVTTTTPKQVTGTEVLSEARRFTGVPYLWAGMSSFGVDCSGLTYRVYERLGFTVPRNASDQAAHGKVVDRRHLKVGDLVFFGRGDRRNIHHVGIYAGHGLLLHAPHTGASVTLTKLSSFADYWGARRYVRS